jgi:hypothetical protein
MSFSKEVLQCLALLGWFSQRGMIVLTQAMHGRTTFSFQLNFLTFLYIIGLGSLEVNRDCIGLFPTHGNANPSS